MTNDNPIVVCSQKKHSRVWQTRIGTRLSRVGGQLTATSRGPLHRLLPLRSTTCPGRATGPERATRLRGAMRRRSHAHAQSSVRQRILAAAKLRRAPARSPQEGGWHRAQSCMVQRCQHPEKMRTEAHGRGERTPSQCRCAVGSVATLPLGLVLPSRPIHRAPATYV